MRINEYVEKTHKKGKIIKYIFCEGKISNQLIVTFPAFAKSNQPPQYNYIRTLRNCKCNRLFILDDYGPRGSYLIGETRDNSIEESVISLINDICLEHSIKKENLIVNGTSKGGYCALYYGIKYKFGYVIAGAPQTKLGDYLSHFPEISDYISGGHETKDKIYLNDLLYNLIEDNNEFPEIYIHVGKDDHHYSNHIIPFLNELDKKKVRYNLELRNYSTHSLIGSYYKEYLLETLHNIDKTLITPQNPKIECTSIKTVNGHLEIYCTSKEDDLKYSLELYTMMKLINKISYQSDPTFKCPVNTPNKYHAKLYVKNDLSYSTSLTDEIEVKSNETLPSIIKYNKLESRTIIEKKFHALLSKIKTHHHNILSNKKRTNKLINNRHELHIDRSSNASYKFTIKNNHDGELFAWYILQNNERIDTIWYRPESFLEYTFEEPGIYHIKYFVKNEHSKVMYSSKPIVLTKEDLN